MTPDAKLDFGDAYYEVYHTPHARIRMEQRGIDSEMVTGVCMALGKDRLESLRRERQKVVVLDYDSENSYVFGFSGSTITKIILVTVFDNIKVFEKRNNKIVEL